MITKEQKAHELTMLLLDKLVKDGTIPPNSMSIAANYDQYYQQFLMFLNKKY